MTLQNRKHESSPWDESPTESILGNGIGLLAQILEDWEAHGCDWTRPGFQAVAVHRFGNWRMGIRRKALRAPFSVIYRALYRCVRNVYGIELPYTTKLGRRVVLEHQHGIVIHGYCVIGDECVIRQGVTLGNRGSERPLDAPRLGHRVNVGAGAKILGGVTIGDDAKIGANAVVTKDVPAQAVAVGIPARVLTVHDRNGGGSDSEPIPLSGPDLFAQLR
jgi:serine O-acetyltransferase